MAGFDMELTDILNEVCPWDTPARWGSNDGESMQISKKTCIIPKVVAIDSESIPTLHSHTFGALEFYSTNEWSEDDDLVMATMDFDDVDFHRAVVTEPPVEMGE